MIRKSLKLLLVEDNPGDVRLVKETFRDKPGIELQQAECLASCFRLLERERYDVVLLDLGLPDSQGLDTVKRFVAAFPKVPLIVLTGLDDDEAGIAAVQAGAEDYLTKGLWAEQALPRAIHYAIERNEVSLQLKRLNEVLRSVRGVNHLIVRESNPDRLMKLCCRELTKDRAYGYAMIGLSDADAGSVSISSSLKPEDEAKIAGFAKKLKPGCLEVQKSDAVLSGAELQKLCRECPFAEIMPNSEKFVTRLECRGINHGILCVARYEDIPTGKEEIDLISQMANDLAFALTNINDRLMREKAEEEKQKLQIHLNQAQKLESIGRLAGGVAHDFNNFLGVIMGYAEMALEKTDSDSEISRDLAEILNAGKRSTEVTRQLLAFARKQAVSPIILDLNQAVVKAMKMLQRLIGEDTSFVLKLADDNC